MGPTAERPQHLAYPPVLNGLGEDAPERSVMHVLSWSSGSVLADAAIGGVTGYFLAPAHKDRIWWSIGGGIATGAAGVAGLLATVAASYARRSLSGRR